MPFKKNLMGVGVPAQAAIQMVGDVENGATATGSSSQTAAYPVTRATTVFSTVSANTGALLPANLSAGDSGRIQNNGLQTLTVYPPVGGVINGGSLNAGVSVATLKGCDFTCIDGLNFSVVTGA